MNSLKFLIPIFLIASVPLRGQAGVVVLGICDASLRKAGGFVVSPEPKVGNQARVFTRDQRWIPVTIEGVSLEQVDFRYGSDVRFSLKLPSEGHYVDLRDPKVFPDPLRHPIQFGIKLGQLLEVPTENAPVLRVYVVRIDLYSGRFFAQPSLPPEMQPPGFVESFVDRMLTLGGSGYSVPFDYPGLRAIDALEQSRDSW